jgi:hypothetical protein
VWLRDAKAMDVGQRLDDDVVKECTVTEASRIGLLARHQVEGMWKVGCSVSVFVLEPTDRLFGGSRHGLAVRKFVCRVV